MPSSSKLFPTGSMDKLPGKKSLPDIRIVKGRQQQKIKMIQRERNLKNMSEQTQSARELVEIPSSSLTPQKMLDQNNFMERESAVLSQNLGVIDD